MEPFWRLCTLTITYSIWGSEFKCKFKIHWCVALSLSNSKLKW
jgi:hypothetical protein